MTTVTVTTPHEAGVALADAARQYAESSNVGFSEAFREVCSWPANKGAVALYLNYGGQPDDAVRRVRHDAGQKLDAMARALLAKRTLTLKAYAQAFAEISADAKNANLVREYLHGGVQP